MTGGLELDGLVATIALLLPVAALLTVILLATRRRRDVRRAPRTEPAGAAPSPSQPAVREVPHTREPSAPLREIGPVVSAPVTPAPTAGRAKTPVPDDGDEAAKAEAAAAAAEAAKRAAIEEARRRRTELDGDIRAAQSANLEEKLASLLLERARCTIEDGAVGEGAEQLRSSIRISARLGLKELHAAARLELGDLARASGDLTTACEHWQIARGLFYDLKTARALEHAETRMRQNGCPTDWVLNDF